MRILLIFLLLITAVTTKAQFYIGYTKQIILKELYNQPTYYDIKETKIDGRTTFIDWKVKDTDHYCIIALYDDIAYQFAIVPLNNISLNSWVETFDKKYIRVSDTEWKYYTDGEMLKIKLVFTNYNDKQLFQFTKVSLR